jgi:hypothetical protein
MRPVRRRQAALRLQDIDAGYSPSHALIRRMLPLWL